MTYGQSLHPLVIGYSCYIMAKASLVYTLSPWSCTKRRMTFSLTENGIFVGYNNGTLSSSDMLVIYSTNFCETAIIDVISLGLVLDSNKWHSRTSASGKIVSNI